MKFSPSVIMFIAAQSGSLLESHAEYGSEYGSGYVKPEPPVPEMSKGKSGTKSGGKYGYDYDGGYDYAYGDEYGYMKKTPSPSPDKCPPLGMIYEDSENEASVDGGSISTFGFNEVYSDKEKTKEVAFSSGSCFSIPSTPSEGTPEIQDCTQTLTYPSGDKLIVNYELPYCPSNPDLVGFNAQVLVGTGCFCGLEGSTVKGTVLYANDPDTYTLDLSTLEESCGNGGWSEEDLAKYSCPEATDCEALCGECEPFSCSPGGGRGRRLGLPLPDICRVECCDACYPNPCEEFCSFCPTDPEEVDTFCNPPTPPFIQGNDRKLGSDCDLDCCDSCLQGCYGQPCTMENEIGGECCTDYTCLYIEGGDELGCVWEE